MSRSCSQDDENTGIAFLDGVCSAVGKLFPPFLLSLSLFSLAFISALRVGFIVPTSLRFLSLSFHSVRCMTFLT